MRGPQAETHCSAQGGAVDFRHEDDYRFRCGLVEFDRGCVGDVADIAREFDHGYLHPETYPQERDIVGSGPMSSFDHPFSAPDAKPARNKDSLGRAEFVPGFVEFHRGFGLGRFF